MGVNWRVRFKQLWFWLTLIPLLFFAYDQISELISAIQAVAIGDVLYDSAVMTIVLKLIGVLFSIMALIGFPVDMTTKGYDDSSKALTYNEPAPNVNDTEN